MGLLARELEQNHPSVHTELVKHLKTSQKRHTGEWWPKPKQTRRQKTRVNDKTVTVKTNIGEYL